MGQGDRSEAHALGCALAHLARHPIASADDEGDVRYPAQRQPVELFGKSLARGLLAADVEQDGMAAAARCIECPHDELGFLLGVAVGKLLHGDVRIASQAFEVFAAGILPETLLQLAYGDNGDLQHYSA